MGWPIFKAQAILKNDYLKFREALASIPKESILERVADTYGISIQEAQTYVDEFLQMVEKYMTVEDVDSAVITRILSKHGGLWQKCNDIAYNKWIADHANEVNTAQEELAALQHKVAQAENDVSSAKEKHGDILREVAEAQDDLCRLQTEIARYKILEKETVAAIREKIAGAQKNVAGFIADLSILLPQATSNESGWKYRHISAVYPEDEVGVSKDWKDELNELSQNLSYSLNVEPDLATMLAAFLYSAHIHNAPILIAGPCGQDIANALSVSLYADNAGQLMFGEQFDCDIADAVNNVNEHIVAAQNMFGKGWGDIIPQMLANSRKHIVWTHPYVEDLAIEPQGLYNYMLPVISECFVGTVSALEPYAGKRSEDFIGYVPKDTHPLRIAAFKKLGKDGKFPVKEDFHEFLRKLYDSKHIPDDEDAELVTRFEMQRFCPDILITNYSMLEYMLLRPIESKIWADTQNWLNADSNNKLLFVIDEAHMYRGSAGGEVSFLIRRLFHRLGIDRSRVQFILTTASMPNKNEEDRRVIQTFANDLTASDDGHEFHYLAGQQEEIGSGRAYDISFDRFTKAHPESFEGDNAERLLALNKFWEGIIDSPAPFSTDNSAYQWLYDHLVDYVPFRELFKLCRGTTASLQELAQSIFPGAELEDAFHAVGVMLAIAPLARSGSGSVLFPARMHMLFRGIKGVYACTNPECSCAHTENGLTLGEVYFTDGNLTCKKCGSTVYELYNDRRCGSIFFRGFVLKQDFDDRKRTYLWHYA